MAKSSADDEELRRACQAATEGTKHKVTLSIRVAKSRGIFGKTGKLSRGHEAKARVLAICTKEKVQRTKAFLRVLKYSNGGVLEASKIYKLKHLSKVEVLTTDPSGCTFMLGFDNMKVRKRAVAPAQWTMRNVDDRNRLLLCIINICKDHLGRLPKVIGMDVVEMALWAKENKPTITKQHAATGGESGPVAAEEMEEEDMTVTVEKDLVSQAEEEDMEALLNTYVMEIGEAEAFSERLKRELQALEAANVHAILESSPVVDEVLQAMDSASNIVEDMDEWLGIFNMKLRHMRQDIDTIEIRTNKLELQSMNEKNLVEELDKLVESFRIPSEYEACLVSGKFEESQMHIHISSCEWLTSALRRLDASNLDSSYAKMRSVREKKGEVEMLKATYVTKVSESLGNFFYGFVDFMVNDKSYFSQKGQLKKPDHAAIRNKCRTFANLLQQLKGLDKNCLGALRKAYCTSLNKLIRKEAACFANELRSTTKLPKPQPSWLEGSSSSTQNVDTSSGSEAYKKILSVFIPLLIDESSFFAQLMCFEVPGIDIDGTGSKGSNSELETLKELFTILIDGIQEDLYTIVDWASKAYPLRCVSMHGITERYMPGPQADAATGIVRIILDSLESRISMQFHRFVDDTCHQVEKQERNAGKSGVLPYIPRFAALATRMEHYIQGNSRDLVDQAYIKIITVMFVTLDKVAQSEPKYADIVLLENYAAFQNSLYDLANVVPTLAKFYHQASEEYEQACLRYINVIIYYQFEKLFAYARKIEDLMATVAAEEVQYQVGFSKSDLRKAVKSGLSGVDKSITAMYKKLQKNLTSDELLPTLWDKCKKEFLVKYDSFANLVSRVYPAEKIPPLAQMKDLVSTM